MKPVGEPDAANPQVRFDERAMETEQGMDIEAPSTERDGNSYARPKPPRHPLDSTFERSTVGRVGMPWKLERVVWWARNHGSALGFLDFMTNCQNWAVCCWLHRSFCRDRIDASG